MSAVIAAISRWVDESEGNAGRDPEALMWHRVMKPAEEMGEVTEAMIGFVGGNPRKGGADRGEVIEELLDVALAALGGVEHLTGNEGDSLRRLERKSWQVAARAGLLDVPA